MAEERISIREFARRVGVSEGAVRKAIETGKIAAACVKKNKKNGRPELLFDKAKADWDLNGGGLRREYRENHKKTITKDEVDAPTKPIQDQVSLAEAKRQSAIYDAKLKGLELAERQKVLVPRTKVYDELFSFGQEIKTHIQSIPDKYIDLILASANRAEAHKILNGAINEALDTLSRTNELKF